MVERGKEMGIEMEVGVERGGGLSKKEREVNIEKWERVTGEEGGIGLRALGNSIPGASF